MVLKCLELANAGACPGYPLWRISLRSKCHSTPDPFSSPEGADPRVEVVPVGERQRVTCDNQIRQWLNAGKLKSSQVAILSPRRQANSSLARVKSLGGCPIVATLSDWKEGKGILFSTVRAFKGLEADALIVIDVSGFSPVLRQADFYVACSRAKHLLTVLTTVPDII
jgi:hypothetical protein